MYKNFTPSISVIFLLAMFFFCTQICAGQTKKIDSLKTALQNEKSEIAKIPILRELSKAYSTVNVDEKFIYAKQYLILAQKNNIDSLIPMAYLDMGIKYGVKTQYDSAMYYFTKALKIAKEKNVESQIARSYVSIGYIFDRLDNPKAAIENYKSALEIFKKLKHKKGLNQTYINLGSLYYDMKEYKIAESYFTEALKIAEQTNDKSAIAQGYFNIGGTSFKLGNDDKAYEYYMKSLLIREKLNDLNGIALAKWGLGELFSKQGKYKEAQEALDIALKNNKILQNKYQESAVLLTMGRNYLKLKQYAKAEQKAKEVLENAKSMTSKGIKVMSLELLIDIAAESKNFKNAFEYQSEVIVARDSLNVEKIKNDMIYSDFQRIRNQNTTLEKSNEVISSKNLTYERAIYVISSILIIVLILLFLYLRKIRQKSKINNILELQTEEISAINEQLESLNEELTVQIDVTNNQKSDLERVNAVKNKFFSIVSHDLRSPIATLKMLFSTYFSGHLTKDEMDDLLKKLQETIYETADFLDNLLEWSKSQLEGMVVKAESFQIQPMVNRTIEILKPQIMEKNLTVENNIGETAYAFADKNMVNVVLRNLLSNSIKFCNSGDSIILNSKVAEKSVLISIHDTGIGINEKDQNKIFQLEHSVSQGTSGETGHHIGLVLCKDMIEQNYGKIWFESTIGVGTTFYVEIPTAEIENMS